MIPWPDDDEMHDPEREEGCWGDRAGVECGRPAEVDGLCRNCHARITGRRAPLVLVPGPPSESFLTGAGRR